MNQKPVLVIMAAGMGSRYGGLKQIDPVDPYGNLIIDFSIYDAKKAGFEKVIFIITKAIEKDFREHIGDRISKQIQVEYAYQEIWNLPMGYTVPAGRKKPWGTGQAILSCQDHIQGPFAVINADDYYGPEAFWLIYQFLEAKAEPAVPFQYTMVGYQLWLTLTDHGHVSRGICKVDEFQKLTQIQELTKIEKHADQAEYLDEMSGHWYPLPQETVVSMNLWGFDQTIFKELDARFQTFLETQAEINPEKSEFFLPTVVGELIAEQKAEVTVLNSRDRWYGVTYQEDKEQVVKAIQSMKASGMYPDRVWGD